MRQLLMLGFYCEVYRQEPVCRIYLEDVLVDEFNIPHTPRVDVWTADMILDPANGSHSRFIHESSQSFYKFIEFDDLDSKSLDIRVEIQNNDNNYSNGFMTRQTLVMLCQCWLASTKIWQGFDKIRQRWKFSLHNWHRNTIPVIQYHIGIRSCIFNNLAAYADMHFTDITQKLQSKAQTKLITRNYQDIPQMFDLSPTRYWVGSSGHFHLTLKKKLGFWRHSTDNRRGWCKLSMDGHEYDLTDKYSKYENTRSIDK